MFSRRKARVIVFVAAVVSLGGGLFVYVTPASTNVVAAPVIADSETTYRSWGQDLSPSAVDAGGIEKDLDGNAASLISSDCLVAGLACRQAASTLP